MERFCPTWLSSLLTAKFFQQCGNHQEGDENRSECNHFCLECAGDPMCFACTISHKSHRIVQIRRSSYHDVIRVSEVQKAIDLSGIQSYIINSARVVFLNGRPQCKVAKGVTKTCEICARSLNDSFRYCSLGCKLEGIKKKNDMTFILQPKTQQNQQQQHRLSNARRVYPEDGTASTSRKSSRIRKMSSKLSSPENGFPEEHKEDAAAKSQRTSSIVKVESENCKATNVSASTTTESREKVANSPVVPPLPPCTPPPQEVEFEHCLQQKTSKRRKGTPHRSHLGL